MEQKYRHEMKYIISQGQLVLLRQRLSGLMRLDSHAGENGYNIRSVYFDDYANRCYYENLSGVDPREKFRIRIYNQNPERISLECKRKECGKTLKTAAPITPEQYRQLMSGTVPPDLSEQPPVLRKMSLEMQLHRMHPVVIVDYDRVPYVCREGNVRITLDTNIASSNQLEHFFDRNLAKRPVLPYGQQLLEVKYDEYLPDYIYRALQLDSLRQTAFSKYFLCRRFSIGNLKIQKGSF